MKARLMNTVCTELRGFDTKEVNFEENPFISCQSSLSIKLVMDGNILC